MKSNILYILFVACLFSCMNGYAINTLHIKWSGDKVDITPDKIKGITIKHGISSGDIQLTADTDKPLTIIVSGETQNGSIRMETNNECTLIFNGLKMTSINGPVVENYSISPMKVVLANGTLNQLCDSSSYKKKESKSIAKACMAFAGPVEFIGDGALKVIANKRHGIKCDSTLTISGGNIRVGISIDSAKGINCKSFKMSGGHLLETAESDITYKDSIITFSSLIKSDSNIEIFGGTLDLIHHGKGGRCLSCKDTLFVNGGNLNLTCTGDGGFFGEREKGKYYWDVKDYRHYYAPQCMSATACILERGNITCLTEGLGGKCIVADDLFQTGVALDKKANDGPVIKISTTGDCIYNDSIKDSRDGCPKGIRARNTLLYSGDIEIKTCKMGGEGIESDSMVIWNPNIVCNTYDDGINVEKNIIINGGTIYCNSIDNDGIDSNGTLYINGGIIASTSQHPQNESLDAEKKQIYIKGGTIFGVSNATVDMQPTTCPIYNILPTKQKRRKWVPDLELNGNEYLYVMKGDSLLMGLRNTDKNNHVSILAMHPDFRTDVTYQLYSSTEPPIRCTNKLFSDYMFIGGSVDKENCVLLKTFSPELWTTDRIKQEINKIKNKQ